MQICYLLLRESQTLLLVVFLKVLHVLDGLWLDIYRKDILVQPLIHTLQHRVILSILAVNGEILLYARDALDGHVLGYLHRIGTPGGNHLASRTHEVSTQLFVVKQRCIVVQPAQCLLFLLTWLMIYLSRNDVCRRSLEE